MVHIIWRQWADFKSSQQLVVRMFFFQNSIFDSQFTSEIETLIIFKFKSDFHRSIELIST